MSPARPFQPYQRRSNLMKWSIPIFCFLSPFFLFLSHFPPSFPSPFQIIIRLKNFPRRWALSNIMHLSLWIGSVLTVILYVKLIHWVSFHRGWREEGGHPAEHAGDDQPHEDLQAGPDWTGLCLGPSHTQARGLQYIPVLLWTILLLHVMAFALEIFGKYGTATVLSSAHRILVVSLMHFSLVAAGCKSPYLYYILDYNRENISLNSALVSWTVSPQ